MGIDEGKVIIYSATVARKKFDRYAQNSRKQDHKYLHHCRTHETDPRKTKSKHAHFNTLSRKSEDLSQKRCVNKVSVSVKMTLWGHRAGLVVIAIHRACDCYTTEVRKQ